MNNGLYTGLDGALYDLTHETIFSINPNLGILKTWKYFGLYSNFSFNLMGPEISQSYDFNIKPVFTYDINNNTAINFFVDETLEADKSFENFMNNILFDISVSGLSEYDFKYFTGISIDYIKNKDIGIIEINPYILFKTLFGLNIFLKPNIITIGDDTGTALNSFNFKISYETNTMEFGLDTTISPIVSKKHTLLLRPFFEMNTNSLILFTSFDITIIQDYESIIGATIGVIILKKILEKIL
jgi:hypothetical protein